jgi:hypothetical protein
MEEFKMRWIKKILFILFILLFFRSVLYDLSVGTASKWIDTTSSTEEKEPSINAPTEEKVNQDEQMNSNIHKDFEVVSYKVKAGDTVLSVAETLNSHPISIDKLLEDFQKLNPNINPHEIHIDQTYLFPVYHEKNND